VDVKNASLQGSIIPGFNLDKKEIAVSNKTIFFIIIR